MKKLTNEEIDRLLADVNGLITELQERAEKLGESGKILPLGEDAALQALMMASIALANQRPEEQSVILNPHDVLNKTQH